LLAVTSTIFPLLYLTLELPKRIINDAIGAQSPRIDFMGYEIGQVAFLGLLCMGFLLAVLVHGLLKMRINRMKGVLSERMLRRFRYQLIGRILRFPQPYFQRTSQGELVSMVTAEAEPLGGLMGDAIAQPVLQTGQMLTILAFLFYQSLWLGIAAIALIPLQAWLIPKLQRQVNLLNKARIQEVRKLASDIGENAAGASTLRTNGGWHYRMAMITDRLGNLYDIRFEIFQKKFFMKFINNFITQLTPFFFFAIGGYLVIEGQLTLGALVAALAAYKDLSSPWKELLAYYNQVQDMSLRWEVITERFAPSGMVDAALFDKAPAKIPRLEGRIVVDDVTVKDMDGIAVFEDLNMTFPKGATVAIAGLSDEERRAMADLLMREMTPARGKVYVADQDLSTLHQSVIAARIGHANSRPFMFDGTAGENAMLPLRTKPQTEIEPSGKTKEALRAGNSPDPLDVSWFDLEVTGFADEDEVLDWWLKLVEGIGSGNELFSRGLEQKFEQGKHAELARKLVELRPKIAEKISAAGLDEYYIRFEPDAYNSELPLAGNLLYATPRQDITQDVLAAHVDFIKLLRDLGLEAEILKLSAGVVEMFRQTFGKDGIDHPLFRKLGFNPEIYETLIEVVHKYRTTQALREDEHALLLTVPFRITAAQIGPAFSDEMKAHILTLRHANADLVKGSLSDMFAAIDPAKYASGLTVMENALFGKVCSTSGAKVNLLREVVGGVLIDEGLKSQVAGLIYDVPTGLGGTNLPSLFAERLAFIRATIKRPDILILDHALASYGKNVRATAAKKLRELMPEATLIFLDDKFEHPENFDVYVELKNGRIKDGETGGTELGDNIASADLLKKLRALATTDLFSGMDRKQLRLLAFSARWVSFSAGDFIFRRGDDAADGAYLALSGEAGLYYPIDGQEDKLISTVVPGRLVGDLALIEKEPRRLDMLVHEDLTALRIGREEFLSVVENDAASAFKLLQVVAGHLMDAAENRFQADKKSVPSE
jgi:ABC-type multidrug transport system fused ATPase/permease subunit